MWSWYNLWCCSDSQKSKWCTRSTFMSTVCSWSSQQSMFLKKDAQHYNYVQLFLGGDGLDALAARVDDLQILLFFHLNVSAAESVGVWWHRRCWMLFIMVTACDVIVHLKICSVVRTCTTDKGECCNATVIQQVCTPRGVSSQNDWDHPVLWNLTGRVNTVLPKKIFSHLRQCRCAIDGQLGWDQVIVKATE